MVTESLEAIDFPGKSYSQSWRGRGEKEGEETLGWERRKVQQRMGEGRHKGFFLMLSEHSLKTLWKCLGSYRFYMQSLLYMEFSRKIKSSDRNRVTTQLSQSWRGCVRDVAGNNGGNSLWTEGLSHKGQGCHQAQGGGRMRG